eukprot:82508-Alexandrium_andersonii.AAC.1
MSASLVGSEMCIRDRGGAWQVPLMRRRVGGPWTRWRSDCWVLATLAPVSYTHLTLPTICSV